MKADQDYYEELFRRLQQGKLSPLEADELMNWLSNESSNAEATELIQQHLETSLHGSPGPEIVTKMKNRLPSILKAESFRSKIYSIGRSSLKYAAVFLVLLSATLFYYFKPQNKVKESAHFPAKRVSTDIAPGLEGAILTLGDGRTILLDTLVNTGTEVSQNGSKILLSKGQVVFKQNGTQNSEASYNSIRTPNGRQIHLALADGTNVWLNAGSLLRFPTAFTGKERNVELTGEGYFEVAKHSSRPFKVTVNDQSEIEVLGTHFNVNAYTNEASIKTTLLEGSVKASF